MVFGYAWNFLPPGDASTRERCLSVGTPKEKEQAVALVAAYREQEAISEANDIDGMSNSFDKLTRFGRNAAGGVEGEMMRRSMSKADPEKYNEAQTKLAGLRQEAMDLVAPVLRRLLVSYSESLAQAAWKLGHASKLMACRFAMGMNRCCTKTPSAGRF